MTEFVYRWNGEYFGFIYNEKLFDKHSNYLGWIAENEIWKKDGSFLGEFLDGHYVMRQKKMPARAVRTIRAVPYTPTERPLKANRALRPTTPGRFDALDEYK